VGQYLSSANAVVAIGTGSVFSSVQVNAYTGAPNVEVSATALAIADQDLYTAGPLRKGTITFTAACMGAYEPVAGFITGCRGELELLDNGHPTFINVACPNSDPDFCQSVTLPVELGAIFSLETSVEYSTKNTFDITTTNKIGDYFSVRELDGS